MQTALALLIGLFFAGGIYLLLSRALIRMLLGMALFSNAVTLLIFVSGRITGAAPPIISGDVLVPAETVVNPLPQALILTAIVIGFSLFAFLLVLAYRAYRTLQTDDTDAMRLAEPDPAPRPPLSY